MKLAQLPRRTASRLPRAAASLARRALSTQPASDDVEESVHDMLRQTCRDFVEAQVKPVAGELDQTHRYPAELVAQMADLSDGCDGARGAGWDGDGLPRLRHRDGGDLGRLRFLRSHHVGQQLALLRPRDAVRHRGPTGEVAQAVRVWTEARCPHWLTLA